MEGVYKISAALKQQALEYRKTLYQKTPGVEKFIQIRRLILCILIAMLVLHEIVNLILMVQGVQSVSYLPENLVKLAVHLVLLGIPFLGRWHYSFGLYFIAITSMMSLYYGWSVISPIPMLYALHPLLVVLLCIEILYTALVAIAALGFTLLPCSRRLADEARVISLEYTLFVREGIFADTGHSDTASGDE